jgi:hypothetical protein
MTLSRELFDGSGDRSPTLSPARETLKNGGRANISVGVKRVTLAMNQREDHYMASESSI